MEISNTCAEQCAEIILVKGLQQQKRKFAEEAFELIEAITEYQSAPSKKTLDHVSEEICDCAVLLQQFMEHLGVTQEEFDANVRFKTQRTINRLNETAF